MIDHQSSRPKATPAASPSTAQGTGDVPPAGRRLVLRRLHDAAQVGDVATAREIFRAHADLHVDAVRRGRNTTLHTALMHNQEGPLIDYLIESGADVNAENGRGDVPLALAIGHCRGRRAVEKLIVAGAKWEGRFASGPHAGLTAMELAVQCGNQSVVKLLEKLADNGDYCREVGTRAPGRRACPVCGALVRFPTKMSRLEQEQECVEIQFRKNGEHRGKKGHKKYLSRRYMDQLLAHSDGEAYKKMCGIEYHELGNARMRKEISESYGVLHAVQECCARLGIGGCEPDPKNTIRLENIFMIDLCSGKGITAALCGALDRPGSNSALLAVDRLLPRPESGPTGSCRGAPMDREAPSLERDSELPN